MCYEAMLKVATNESFHVPTAHQFGALLLQTSRCVWACLQPSCTSLHCRQMCLPCFPWTCVPLPMSLSKCLTTMCFTSWHLALMIRKRASFLHAFLHLTVVILLSGSTLLAAFPPSLSSAQMKTSTLIRDCPMETQGSQPL